MDPRKRRALQRLTVELSSDMNPDDMRRALYAKQMLTRDEVEQLSLPGMTTRDKNMFLLLKIPSKGIRAFDYFVDCLQETAGDNPNHHDLVEQLLRKLRELESGDD